MLKKIVIILGIVGSIATGVWALDFHNETKFADKLLFTMFYEEYREDKIERQIWNLEDRIWELEKAYPDEEARPDEIKLKIKKLKKQLERLEKQLEKEASEDG